MHMACNLTEKEKERQAHLRKAMRPAYRSTASLAAWRLLGFTALSLFRAMLIPTKAMLRPIPAIAPDPSVLIGLGSLVDQVPKKGWHYLIYP